MSKAKPLALYLAQRHTLTLNDFSHFLWLNPSLALCAEHGCWSPACTAETPFANAVAASTSPAGTLFLGVKGSNMLPTLLTTKGEEKLVTLMIQVYASYCSHFPPHQKIKREKKKILILPHNHFKWTLFFNYSTVLFQLLLIPCSLFTCRNNCPLHLSCTSSSGLFWLKTSQLLE